MYIGVVCRPEAASISLHEVELKSTFSVLALLVVTQFALDEFYVTWLVRLVQRLHRSFLFGREVKQGLLGFRPCAMRVAVCQFSVHLCGHW